MSEPRTLDLAHLPDLGFMQRSPLFWGAIGLICIEGSMFALLIASYYYARLNVDAWPPPGVQFPHLLLPSIGLALLVISCVPAYVASEAAKRNERSKIILHLGLNLALAMAAMALRIVEWDTFNFEWASDIHGSLVWTMMGLHSFDMGAGILITAVLFVYAISPRFNDTHRKGIDFDSVTWYFLVAIWVPLYATIYVAPHLIQAS